MQKVFCYLLLSSVSLFGMSSVFASVENKSAQVIHAQAKDLKYGSVLYELYQGHAFEALSALNVAKVRGGITGHNNHPALIEGSLMLVSQVLSLTGVPFSRIMRRVQKERKDHYSHLHGFFQGEHTDMSPEGIDRIEFANAIILTENSFANGRSIASLNLASKRVIVVALRRNDIESEQPDESTVLQAQDTLIVRGKPRRVERAERFVQEGD